MGTMKTLYRHQIHAILFDLGNVFPTNLQEVDDYLLLARYADLSGNFGEFDVVVVPEPANTGRLFVGLVCMIILFAIRRRHSVMALQ